MLVNSLINTWKAEAMHWMQASAPGPAPEQGPAARRDMPPLPPVMPGMSAGAQPPQPGSQGVRSSKPFSST